MLCRRQEVAARLTSSGLRRPLRTIRLTEGGTQMPERGDGEPISKTELLATLTARGVTEATLTL